MTNAGVKLVYGLRDGGGVHISAVERGLACGCVCSSCGEQLVAKKGNVQQHHFAHASAADCAGAVESALHLVAKEILSRKKAIVLPAVRVQFDSGNSIEINPEGPYPISEVRLEKGVGGIVPDVLVKVGDWELALEVFVTHRVDEGKLQRFRNLGLSVVEIDLSEAERELSPDQLEALIIGRGEHKRWLFNVEAERRKQASLAKARRLDTVYRGAALHVDGCPIVAREYRGKPYANVIDDCVGCPHCLSLDDQWQSLVCDGHLGCRQEDQARRTLVWQGRPVSVDFVYDGVLVRKTDVDVALRARDGIHYVEGFNHKQKERTTYRVDKIEAVVDMETGEMEDARAWFESLTRSWR